MPLKIRVLRLVVGEVIVRFRPSPPALTVSAAKACGTSPSECQQECQQNVTLSELSVTPANSPTTR
jgi:hypothetical protein